MFPCGEKFSVKICSHVKILTKTLEMWRVSVDTNQPHRDSRQLSCRNPRLGIQRQHWSRICGSWLVCGLPFLTLVFRYVCNTARAGIKHLEVSLNSGILFLISFLGFVSFCCVTLPDFWALLASKATISFWKPLPWLFLWGQLRVSFHRLLSAILAGPHGSVLERSLSLHPLFQIADLF